MRFLFFSFLFCVAGSIEARLPELIPFRKGDLWGYSDSTKKILIEPTYESADFFAFGRAVVKKNGKYGVINASGMQVIPFLYKEINPGLVSGHWSAILMGNSYGVIDSTGKFVIPAVHKAIWWTGGPYVATFEATTVSVLDLKGNSLFTRERTANDQLPFYVPETRAFIFSVNNRFGATDLAGRAKIPFAYDELTYNACHYFIAKKEGVYHFFKRNFKRWKKSRAPKPCRAVIETPVKWIVPAYSIIKEHTKAPAMQYVTTYPDDDSIILRKVWGWQENDGSWLVIPKYDSTGYFSHGLATFTVKGQMGMVNSGFKEIIAPKYESLVIVHPQFAMVMRKPRVDFAKHPDLRMFLGYVDVRGTEYWLE